MAVTYGLFAHLGLAAPAHPETPETLFLPTSAADEDELSSDDDAPIVFTVDDCTEIAGAAGCCLGSLINVRYPAGFVFYSLHAAMAISDMAEQCQAFALVFPELVSSAGHTPVSNVR